MTEDKLPEQDMQTNMQTILNNIENIPAEVPVPKTSIIGKKSRVFMLEECQNVDVTPAFEYGAIIPLFKSTNGDEKRRHKKSDRPSMWETEEFKKEVLKRLLEYGYDPEVDYLLTAGHVIPLIIFVATVVAEWENIQVLFWSSGYERYVVRNL